MVKNIRFSKYDSPIKMKRRSSSASPTNTDPNPVQIDSFQQKILDNFPNFSNRSSVINSLSLGQKCEFKFTNT